jgi:phosphatidylglycerophosphatase A
MNTIRKLLLTGLGSGYLPASGTWGSAIACAVYLAVAYGLRAWGSDLSCGAAGAILNLVMLALLVLACVGCVVMGKFAEQAFGCKDPGQVNLDEVAGQSLALLLMPVCMVVQDMPARTWAWHPTWHPWGHPWVIVLTAFVAFRFFDILKPPPIRRLEELPHGWGVLMDDLLAGVYANVAAQLLARIVIP